MTERPDGWYPDPDDPSVYRFWDGNEWTTQTRARAAAFQAGWRTHPGTGRFAYYDGSEWLDIPAPPVSQPPPPTSPPLPHLPPVPPTVQPVPVASIPSEFSAGPALGVTGPAPAQVAEKSSGTRWPLIVGGVLVALAVLGIAAWWGRTSAMASLSNQTPTSDSAMPDTASSSPTAATQEPVTPAPDAPSPTPVKVPVGLTQINTSDPETAQAVVSGYFNGTERTIYCYDVLISISDPNCAYEGTSEYGNHFGQECHIPDGNQVIMTKVDGSWQTVQIVGTGVFDAAACADLFSSSLGQTASAAVRRDFYSSIADGQCKGAA